VEIIREMGTFETKMTESARNRTKSLLDPSIMWGGIPSVIRDWAASAVLSTSAALSGFRTSRRAQLLHNRFFLELNHLNELGFPGYAICVGNL
jgi:hypothetical protein